MGRQSAPSMAKTLYNYVTYEQLLEYVTSTGWVECDRWGNSVGYSNPRYPNNYLNLPNGPGYADFSQTLQWETEKLARLEQTWAEVLLLRMLAGTPLYEAIVKYMQDSTNVEQRSQHGW